RASPLAPAPPTGSPSHLAPRAPPPLRLRFRIITQPPHDFAGLPDIRLTESGAHGRSDHQEAVVQLAVAHVAFGGQLHKLRAPVLRVVDECDEPVSRKFVR